MVPSGNFQARPGPQDLALVSSPQSMVNLDAGTFSWPFAFEIDAGIG